MKVHEVTIRSGVDQTPRVTRSQNLVRMRMTPQFADSTPSKLETVVANLRIVWCNSEDLNDEEELRQNLLCR